ncbi:MAG: hypothetical protein AAGF26_13085, partial [Cyanobacteria bacterium P01_G01_bin.49]
LAETNKNNQKIPKKVIIKRFKIDSFSFSYLEECQDPFKEEVESFQPIQEEKTSYFPSLEAYIVGNKSFYLIMDYIEKQNLNEEQMTYNSYSNFLIKEQSEFLLSDIIKFINNIPRLHPRKFCRRWFHLESLREDGRFRYQEEQILEIESEWCYREQCINLLAKILKLKPNTIQRWGKGVEFDKIPLNKQNQYEMYLGYVDAIRTLFIKKHKNN